MKCVNRPKKSKPVGVLTKAFRILALLQNSHSPMNLKEISAQSGINKSTALRLLAHLEREKYVSRDEKGDYSPGSSLVRVGGPSEFQETIRRIARPHLWELWRSTQETVNLAMLDGLEVVYLDCLESVHEFRLVAHIGMRAVLYRTALGKAMLAFLPAERREAILRSLTFQAFTPNTVVSAEQLRNELEQIRELGYAVDNEESHLGLRCVAAPVLGSSREAVAAISVSSTTGRLTLEKVSGLGAVVRQAAESVAARLTSAGGE